MTSEVYWTVLGLIIEAPDYGAELFRSYQREYDELQPVSESSHIYAAINELEDRGYIREVRASRRSRAGVGRQPRPHYEATELGIRDFIDHLVEQAEADRKSHELWLRQLAAFAEQPSVALHVLGRFQRICLQRVGTLGEGAAGEPPEAREELVAHLAAKHERFAGGGTLSWLKYTIAIFEARAGRAARDGTPRT